MGLLGGGISRRRLAAMKLEADAQAADQRARQDKILKQQQTLSDRELKLNKQALNEQKRQNAEIRTALAKQTEIAERPAPPPPPPAAVMVTGGTAEEGAGDDSAIDIRRRGRGALRIDMNSPQSGGGATGLNVPRG
jgi:hypothetical protein